MQDQNDCSCVSFSSLLKSFRIVLGSICFLHNRSVILDYHSCFVKDMSLGSSALSHGRVCFSIQDGFPWETAGRACSLSFLP